MSNLAVGLISRVLGGSAQNYLTCKAGSDSSTCLDDEQH